MAWWDDLWLNEGFASWIEKLPMAVLKPEWKIDVDEAIDGQGAMNLDALASTRAIHSTVETPAEIEGQFDAIAYQKGAKVEVDCRVVQARLLLLGATGLRGRPDPEKGHIRDALRREAWPLFDTGRLRPVTDRVFPLAEAGAAHGLMQESSHIGKILLAP
jgi:NADPH:quinone reductase-like Zn-dependent oxidoreductase